MYGLTLFNGRRLARDWIPEKSTFLMVVCTDEPTVKGMQNGEWFAPYKLGKRL
jgi:hypothetical protein